jgi:hypothetical protein
MTDTIKRKQNREQGSHKKEEPRPFTKATIEQLLELQKHINENYSQNNGRGKNKN